MQAWIHKLASLSSRQVYYLMLVLVFIVLPLLSLNAGISGDEPVHYQQGKFVHEYFSSDKTSTSALETPVTRLKYYGQVLDNMSYSINHLFNIQKPYVTRHLLNALCGALLILFSALISVSMAGFRAGILTILLLFLSPRVLGHSLNNLKDIPFALGYIISIWGIISCIQLYPRIKIPPLLGIAAGFALAFGTRAGGLIIVPLVYFFGATAWLLRHKGSELYQTKVWLYGFRFFGVLSLALLAGYFIALINWPYARLAVFANPLESLKLMTHYEVSIRQVFEGNWYWSEHLPWYYPVKYILITTPVIIIAGFIAQFKLWQKKNLLTILILDFVIIFPLVWIIARSSNLYGGWRHVLFIYPGIAIIAALVWDQLLMSKKSWIKITSGLVLLAGLAGPAYHIARNHPVEYVYFNLPSGGIQKANGKYETDYYFHSLGPAVKWMKDFLNREHPEEKITLASNFDLRPYFVDSKNIETVYVHYYNRGKADWDYGLFVGNYLYPEQLNSGNWPPANTFHSINVSGVAVCAIVERKTRDDVLGYRAYKKSDFHSSVELLRRAVDRDQDNETAQLYLAWALRQLHDYDSSDLEAKVLLKKVPGYDTGLDVLGRNLISRGQYEESLTYFEQIINNNYKFLPAYEQAAHALDSLGRYSEAAGKLERAYSLGLRDSSSLIRLVRMLEASGSKAKADKFRMILNKK